MPEKNVFRRARRQVAQNERALRRVRVGGYRALDKAIENIYGNLMTSQRGMARRLTHAQARDMQRIQTMTARMRQANRRSSNVTSEYLTDLGGNQVLGGVTQARGVLNRAEREGKAAGRRNVGLGAAGVKSAAGVTSIMKESAKEQAVAADYMASEALSQRTTQDTALIAEQEFAIAQQEMAAEVAEQQAQRDFARQKKLMVFEQKMAERSVDNPEQLRGAVEGFVGVARMIREGTRSGMTADDIMTERIAPLLQSASPTEYTAIMSMFDLLTSDTTEGAPDNVSQEIMSVIRDVPGWEKAGSGKRDRLANWVRSAVMDFEDYASKAAGKAAATTGADGGTPLDPTGMNYSKYRAALEKRTQLSAETLEETRDTTIEWYRANAIAAVKRAAPTASQDRVEFIVDRAIDDGIPWLQEYESNLSPAVLSALKETYLRLPAGNNDYGRGVFEGFLEGQGALR